MATSASLYGGDIQFGWTEERTVVASANGDPMLVRDGTTTLTSTTPAYSVDGSDHRNGLQVNPSSLTAHGWDNRISGFDSNLIVDLPYSMQVGDSIVKVASLIDTGDWSESTTYGNPDKTELATAGVLSVIAEAPASLSFRPPYFGTTKPIIPVSDLDLTRLSELAPVSNMPSLANLERRFERLQLDHKITAAGRRSKPWLNMHGYDGFLARDTENALLRLMQDDDEADKLPLLYSVVQYGIDLYHYWLSSDGPDRFHGGRKSIAIFTALMLGKTEWIENIKEWAGRAAFYEDSRNQWSQVARVCLWGERSGGESGYWGRILNGTGSQATADPYSWIDGGTTPGTYNDLHNLPKWAPRAIMAKLMPGFEAAWNNVSMSVGHRAAEIGRWTKPDPYKLVDSMEDIGDQDCIGRFTHLHNTGQFGASGTWKSLYAEALYAAVFTDTPLFAPWVEPYGGTFSQSVEVTAGSFSRLTPEDCTDYWDSDDNATPPVNQQGEYPYIEGGTIRYTIDGSDVTESSDVWTNQQFTLDDADEDGRLELRLKEFKEGHEPSATQIVVYQIESSPIVRVVEAFRAMGGVGTNAEISEVNGVTTPIEGNLLVFAFWGNAGDINDIDMDQAGWTKLFQGETGNAFNQAVLAVFYKIAGASEPTTFSASHDGTARRRGSFYAEYSGLDAADPVAGWASNLISTASDSHPSGTTGTLGAAALPRKAIGIFAQRDLDVDEDAEFTNGLSQYLRASQTSFADAGRPTVFAADGDTDTDGTFASTATFDKAVVGVGSVLVLNPEIPPDEDPPVPVSFEIAANGVDVTGTFADDSPPLQGDGSGFSITDGDGVARTLTFVDIDGLDINWTIDPPVPGLDPDEFEFVANYDAGVGNMTDSADTPNAMESFTAFPVVNGSAVEPPGTLEVRLDPRNRRAVQMIHRVLSTRRRF